MWQKLFRLFGRTQDERSVLGHRVHIRGEITSGGELEIRGRVEGDIEHTGRLIIGPGGRCISNIRADELQVAGEIHGNVHVDDMLELMPTGRLYGDTVCGLLKVHPGATVLGTTHMLNAVPEPLAFPARTEPTLPLIGPLAVLSEPVSGRERAELFRPRRHEELLEPMLVELEPMLVEPEMVLAEPEPMLVEPEMVLVEPEMVLAEPEMVLAEPVIVLAEPEVVLAQPEPLLAEEPAVVLAEEPAVELAEPERGARESPLEQIPAFYGAFYPAPAPKSNS